MDKYVLQIWNSVDSNRSDLYLSDEAIRIWNSFFQSKVMIRKTSENGWNCYVAEKLIVSKLSKVPILDFDSTNLRFGKRLWHNFTFPSSILFEK